ncbi:unnamed protein product, partial [Caenorhabditis brenneri]
MVPPTANHWTTEPEYIKLLNYIIGRTENVESPMCIKRLARDFKGKSGTALTTKCVHQRIGRVRKIIHSFKHIDTKKKVKMLFALSASVNPEFLEELKKDAFVENDDEIRITHYKANDGGLELRGDHSRSAKMSTGIQESKRSYRSLITSYFENKNDPNAVPMNVGQGEMWKLIEFITEKCEYVDSPLSITRLAEDFVEKFRTSIPGAVISRIKGYGLEIQRMEFVGTRSKVQQLFGLSATLESECLEKLRKNAQVEIDEKNRIVFYKANDGSLELRGEHSRTAKRKAAKPKSNGTHQRFIRNYFKNKNNADAVPVNELEKMMWNLIEWITEKCDNVNTPLNITRVAKDFIQHFGVQVYAENIRKRMKSYCRVVQKGKLLDTQTSVKQLFGLSATVISDYLEILRKDAHVKVDKKNRISYYKANDGSLEIRGDHSLSAKTKTAILESKRSFRSLINSYFEKKNDADALPTSEEKKEIGNLIEFITEKCENVNSPLSVSRFAEDFIQHFGKSVPLDTIVGRIRRYCHEIQTVEFLDTSSKVKQLFGMSTRLDSNFLKELRKDADVEVDNLNRITKYTSNNGRLTLHGDHSHSAKTKPGWIQRRKKKSTVKKHCNPDGDKSEDSEKENRSSEDDSDEYSSEESDSESESDDEKEPLDETEDPTFDNETPSRNRSPTEMPNDDNFDFDPPTEMGEDQENDPGITENAVIMTRSGRLSKRTHLDTEFSYSLANCGSSEAAMNTESASSKPAKQRKIAIDKDQPSNSSSQSRRSSISVKRYSRDSSFSTFPTESEENMENQDAPRAMENPSDYHEPRIQEVEDYDYNPKEDNIPENSSVDNRLREPELSTDEDHNTNIEAQNTDNRADAVAPEPEPVEETLTHQNNKNTSPGTNGKEVISQDVPIKMEHEEPILAGHPTEDVKPVTAHNTKMKFFEAMKSLILFLDTPSLSNLQSKIHQKIRKMKGSKEVLQNNELIPALELLIARMVNHSVIDISKRVKTVSLIQFFCYLKASILNSKMIGVEGLMNNISMLIEKSHNK